MPSDKVQIQGQMDEVSKLKMFKGAIIALTGAVAVLVLLLAFGVGVDQAVLTSFIAWLVPAGVNAGKEFMKGVPPELLDQLTGEDKE